MPVINRREFMAAAAASAGFWDAAAFAGNAGKPATPKNVPVLGHADVVFMYQADPKTYAEYRATAVAWGGAPNRDVLADAKGLRFFGSVGMVTEFARYFERFPAAYEQGLCRDVFGNPAKVPWLTDMRHKGIPFWWCCTNQPLFRQYVQERVEQTVKDGAHGVHIDDHMGTAGGLWLGVCFCDRCVEGFRAHLAALPSSDLAGLTVEDPGRFDFRAEARKWAEAHGGKPDSVTNHPLWPRWTTYQCRAAAAFMMELRNLAAKTAGHPVPIGANAGLLWPRHLSDYKAVDLFSAETDHGAQKKLWIDTPLVAYRLADAVGRPYAATASGMDWAFIKENRLPGLVRGWISFAYAAGQSLMVPHHQWCYTPEKGTHWYDGPSEKFTPLYRFVRANAALFDGFDAYADLNVVLPHRSFTNSPARWTALFDRLAAANLAYRILLAGDEIVDRPLTPALLDRGELLVMDRDALLPADSALVSARMQRGPVFTSVEQALAAIVPAVQVESSARVLALPRTKPGAAAIHLVSRSYDPAADDAAPLRDVRVKFDAKALGLSARPSCRVVAPGAPPLPLAVDGGAVRIPSLGLWSILDLRA